MCGRNFNIINLELLIVLFIYSSSSESSTLKTRRMESSLNRIECSGLRAAAGSLIVAGKTFGNQRPRNPQVRTTGNRESSRFQVTQAGTRRPRFIDVSAAGPSRTFE